MTEKINLLQQAIEKDSEVVKEYLQKAHDFEEKVRNQVQEKLSEVISQF